MVVDTWRREQCSVSHTFTVTMPAAVDECRVDGEVVRPQEGGFYGGWITDAVVGPFKGIPGSWGW